MASKAQAPIGGMRCGEGESRLDCKLVDRSGVRSVAQRETPRFRPYSYAWGLGQIVDAPTG